MRLEETDKKILNIIVENSRLSLRQIAQKAGVSAATVMHHLRHLEKEGIIRKYTAKLDYEKMGYDVEVIIEIRVSKGRLLDVEKKIAMDPNVFAVYDTTGAFDAAILARFPTRRMMDNFLKRIQTYEFVERTETRLILRTMKEENIGAVDL